MFSFERKIQNPSRRASRLATLFLVPALAFSHSLSAVTEAELFNNEAFLNLYATILQVNIAMKTAAMNPMDTWRRKAVRDAILKLPPALIGLAEVFESGKLHDDDYQYVMGLLGGFVDQKSAPKIYSQFLKKPSADLIPKAGGALQARLERESASGSAGSRIVYDDNAPQADAQSAQASARPVSKEVVNLSSLESFDDKPASSRVVYDENASAPSAISLGAREPGKTAPGYKNSSLSAAQSASQPSRTPASSIGVASELQSDLSVIESEMEKDSVFSNETLKPSLKRKAKAGRSTAPVAPKEGKPVSQLHHGFHSRLIASAFGFLPLLSTSAHAEGGPPCTACQSARGGGGGGGGGPGGGGPGGPGGINAAQALFGVAAVMATIVPAIVASQQAEADQNIAQTNANAQMYMTDAVARNSQQLAAMQQQTATYQTNMASATAAANNQAVTDRLNMQMAQLNASQQRIAAMEQQQFAAEQDLNMKRMQLSEQQLAANIAAAQAAQSLQLTQAGLSNGSLPGDSGSALSTAQTGLAFGATAPNTTGVATNPLGNNTTVNPTGLGLVNSNTASNSANSARAMTSASASVGSSVASAGAPSPARGLSSTNVPESSAAHEGTLAKPPSDTVVFAESSSNSSDVSSGSSSSSFTSLLPAVPANEPSARLTSSIQSADSGLASSYSRAMTSEPQLVAYLQNQRELNGSTRRVRAKAAPATQKPAGDLGQFIAGNARPAPAASESFAQFQQSSRNTGVARGIASKSGGHGGASPVSSRGMTGRPAAQAYNPPTP